jgi:geranylgeranyl pyrophosphate synthase
MATGGRDRSLVGLVTGVAETDLVAGVESRLREVAKVVRRSMLDALPDGEPSQWLYAPMREYPSRPGKALRPALCLSAGRVFGASNDDLLGLAVAIELLHNAFLVHDDIVDGSEMRRGRPTLSVTHGMAAALNAGDALVSSPIWCGQSSTPWRCARSKARRSKSVGSATISKPSSRRTIST